VKIKSFLVGLTFLAASSVAMSQNVELASQLQKKFPNTQITSADFINEIPGLVEVVVGKNKIIYTNAEGTLFLIGHIFDSRSNEDLTQARIDSLTSYKWSDLPLNDAIKVVKGNGSREFAVFTDPACPYCKKLEQEVAKLDNYTMYVFPTPFKPQGMQTFSKIMCESNPGKAWTDLMQKGIQPSNQGNCQLERLNRTLGFATSIGVSGTPSLLSKSGKLNPGYLPAAKLNAWLSANNK
jgi:thiol:disulfide interchange protein DsbC